MACVPETDATTDVGGPGGRGVVGTPGPGPAVGVGVGVSVGVGVAEAEGVAEAGGVAEAEGVAEGVAEELAEGVGEGVTTEPAGAKEAMALRALLIATVHDVAKPVQAPVQPAKSAAGLGTACSVTVCVVG